MRVTSEFALQLSIELGGSHASLLGPPILNERMITG